MKNLYAILLIATILFGCNERTNESEIAVFEKELGYEMANGLTKVVEHFDGQLLYKYPDLTIAEAYEKHLNFILNYSGLSITEWLPAQFRKDSIFNLYSNELIKDIWIKPDSVWISDSRLYWTARGDNNPTSRKVWDSITNYDSLIYVKQNTEFFNYQGNFLRAMKKISDTNEIAKWYYDIKSAAGNISPHISAQTFLNSRVELDDYLVKRITLIETFTVTCSNTNYKP